jgi:uncharacterized protein with GYD domain
MALYLARFSYPGETWAKLIENPEDRRGPVGELAESIGGKLLGLWYAFGEGDGYALFEAPDNVSIAAALATVAASGALTNLSTTVLVSVEEMSEALEKAKSIKYQPPGGSGGPKAKRAPRARRRSQA